MQRKLAAVCIGALVIGLFVPIVADAQSWVTVGDVRVYNKSDSHIDVFARGPDSLRQCDQAPLEVTVQGVPRNQERWMYVVDSTPQGDRVIWYSRAVKDGTYEILPYNRTLGKNAWAIGRHNIRIILSSHARFSLGGVFYVCEARYLVPRVCDEVVKTAYTTFTVQECLRPLPPPPEPDPCRAPDPCCTKKPTCGVSCIGLIALLLFVVTVVTCY